MAVLLRQVELGQAHWEREPAAAVVLRAGGFFLACRDEEVGSAVGWSMPEDRRIWRGVEGMAYVGEDGLAQLFGLVEYVSTRRPEADADNAEPTDALRVAGGARSFSAAEEWLALTLSEYVGAAFHGLEAARAEIEGLRLVHRMLPRHIVRQLQKRSPELVVEKCRRPDRPTPRTPPDARRPPRRRSQRTFVLFSDIVSFTSYCASREPRDVVVMLNSLFATFDAQLAKHSVFKAQPATRVHGPRAQLNGPALPA